MLRLVHLTDPHLSALDGHSFWSLEGKRKLGYLSWMRRRRHHHRREMLDRVCAAVRDERPDVVAITGDLVQLGLADEIAAATAWLAGFGDTAIVLVPGNHDAYRADAAASIRGAWAQYFGLSNATDAADADFPSVRAVQGCTVIGLSSASPQPFWSAAGEIGTEQLRRLDAILGRSTGSLRCVLLHHPPLVGQCARRKALVDAAALSALLDRHGVEIVLHGHVHRNETHLLGVRTRVLATASASNVATHARASYRVFDIVSSSAGWEVSSLLKSLPGTGPAQTVASFDWEFQRLN
jgi:3',5'-cyclic AMP phosphodiesterase CpdA